MYDILGIVLLSGLVLLFTGSLPPPVSIPAPPPAPAERDPEPAPASIFARGDAPPEYAFFRYNLGLKRLLIRGAAQIRDYVTASEADAAATWAEMAEAAGGESALLDAGFGAPAHVVLSDMPFEAPYSTRAVMLDAARAVHVVHVESDRWLAMTTFDDAETARGTAEMMREFVVERANVTVREYARVRAALPWPVFVAHRRGDVEKAVNLMGAVRYALNMDDQSQ